MFEGTWRTTDGGRSDLVVERVGDAWHLAWRGPAGAGQEGCAIAVGPWLYAARTPADAAEGRASGTTAEYDSRSGIIVYDVAVRGEWPATFYHPRDGGKLTTASSGKVPGESLEGRFLVGYQSQSGERHDGIAMIVARRGDGYGFTWDKDGTVLYEGVGLQMGPRLAAAWGLPGFDHQLVIGHLEGEGSAATLTCTRVSMGAAGAVTERYRRA